MTTDPRLLRKTMDEVRDALDELCDEQKRTVWREDGTITRHTAPSLLDQLRDEVANSSNRGGRRRTSTTSPVAVDALDLWNSVCDGALYLAASTGAHLDGGGAEYIIRASVTAVGTSTDLEAMLGVRNYLRAWTNSIRTLLDPPKRVPLWGHACPLETCGEQTVWREDESDGGEKKRTAALEASFEDTPKGVEVEVIRCLACSEEWPRAKVLFLALLMGRDLAGIDWDNADLPDVDAEGEPAA